MTDSWRNSSSAGTRNAPQPGFAHTLEKGRAGERVVGDLVGIGARDNSRWSQGVRLGASARSLLFHYVCALCRLTLNGETSTKVPLPEPSRDTRINRPQRPRREKDFIAVVNNVHLRS